MSRYKRCCGLVQPKAPKSRESAPPDHATLSNKERKELARLRKTQTQVQEAARKADPKASAPVDLGMIGI